VAGDGRQPGADARAGGRPGGEHHVELVQRLAGGPVNQDRIDLGAGTIIPLSS
jgi:hypothetical protein